MRATASEVARTGVLWSPQAKAMAGMTGVKADTFDYDTGLTIKPRGYHQVILVDFE
jgi:hypothetical protein